MGDDAGVAFTPAVTARNAQIAGCVVSEAQALNGSWGEGTKTYTWIYDALGREVGEVDSGSWDGGMRTSDGTDAFVWNDAGDSPTAIDLYNWTYTDDASIADPFLWPSTFTLDIDSDGLIDEIATDTYECAP